MADKKEQKKPAEKVAKEKSISKKKSMSVRERAAKSQAASDKPKRIRSVAGKASKPVSKVKKISKKEVHIPLPDNKAGRILKKRVRFVPKFVREAFAEVKQVTWPDWPKTISLTFAVFIFAIIFAGIVGALDYVLGELFKELFVN